METAPHEGLQLLMACGVWSMVATRGAFSRDLYDAQCGPTTHIRADRERHDTQEARTVKTQRAHAARPAASLHVSQAGEEKKTPSRPENPPSNLPASAAHPLRGHPCVCTSPDRLTVTTTDAALAGAAHLPQRHFTETPPPCNTYRYIVSHPTRRLRYIPLHTVTPAVSHPTRRLRPPVTYRYTNGRRCARSARMWGGGAGQTSESRGANGAELP